MVLDNLGPHKPAAFRVTTASLVAVRQLPNFRTLKFRDAALLIQDSLPGQVFAGRIVQILQAGFIPGQENQGILKQARHIPTVIRAVI